MDKSLAKFEQQAQHQNALIAEMSTCLPFIKVSTGKYLLGTEVRQIQLKGSGCLVRTGKRLMYLDEWLRHYSRSETFILNVLMQSTSKNYQDAVVFLLHRHRTSQDIVDKYILLMEASDDINDQFARLVTRVTVLESQQKIKLNASLCSTESFNNSNLTPTKQRRNTTMAQTPQVSVGFRKSQTDSSDPMTSPNMWKSPNMPKVRQSASCMVSPVKFNSAMAKMERNVSPITHDKKV